MFVTYQPGVGVFNRGDLVDYRWAEFSYGSAAQALSVGIGMMLSDPTFDRVYLCRYERRFEDDEPIIVDIDGNFGGAWAIKKGALA